MKTLTKNDKIIYLVFGILILLVALFNFINPSTYSFCLVSALANLFLILIFRKILKLLNIKYTKKQILTIVLAIIAIYIFYAISLYGRKFLYFADYACYYNIQLTTRDKFASSFIEGVRYFGGSTLSGEYGNFLSFFPEIVFNFTNKTIDSFIFSYILVYIPYIILSFSILLKKIIQIFNIKNEDKGMTLGILSLMVSPIFNATAIYGQPDFFGLTFVFLIIALTISYKFKKVEQERLILLTIVTIMLLITRRWYLYWIIAYFICYVIRLIMENIKNPKELKIIFKNGIIYTTTVIGIFGLLLFSMLKNAIIKGVGDYSAFYLTGGFTKELLYQAKHQGYLIMLIMILGIIYGLKIKEHRSNTIFSIIAFLLTILLFTRIQNMGLHHSLILLPSYLYWIYLSIVLVMNIDNGKYKRYCMVIISIMLINFIYASNGILTEKLFTDIPVIVYDEESYNECIEVAKWLKDNLNAEETGYMISHNGRYNPDKFRNVFMPDKTLYNYLPYGSAIIGSHYFPVGLFDAKYILTTTPFESVSIEYKYNDVFNKLVEEGKFNLIETFDMNNGYKILIYKRIKKVDIQEKKLYLNALEEESALYPNLYEAVIEEYEIN